MGGDEQQPGGSGQVSNKRPRAEQDDTDFRARKRRTDPLNLREDIQPARRKKPFVHWYKLEKLSGDKCKDKDLDALSGWLVLNVVLKHEVKLAGTFLEDDGWLKIGVYDEKDAVTIGSELRGDNAFSTRLIMSKMPGKEISCRLSLRSGVPSNMSAQDIMKTVLLLNNLPGKARAIETYGNSGGYSSKLKFIPDAEMLADLKKRQARNENLHICATQSRIRLDDPEARQTESAEGGASK
jgi:hypothetical protein